MVLFNHKTGEWTVQLIYRSNWLLPNCLFYVTVILCNNWLFEQGCMASDVVTL